jgi:hypothetical protein
MIGRRAIVGISLLSALLFCASGVQGASAAAHTSENTTAFTCVKGGGKLDFKDAHCDETTAAGKGEYGHELIPAGPTQFEITNKETANKTTEAAPLTLKSKLAGVETHTNCSAVSGSGNIENGGSGLNHKVTGSVTLEVSKCTVIKPANCKVKEPIVWKATFMGADQIGAEKNTMGLEFVPESGNFTEITFEGEKCALKGSTFGTSGTAIVTGAPGGSAKESGATWIFEPGNGMEEMTWGGSPDEMIAILTTRMKGGGNPISLTTAT